MDSNNTAQATLVVLAQIGDRAAFGELVKRHQHSVRGLCLRLSRDAVLADDLAQQTFILGWQKISSLKHSQALGTWLQKIATNQWLAHVRRNDPLATQTSIEDEASSLGEAVLENTGMALDLDRALAQLPVMPRTCVVLAYQAGMTHPEIAEVTQLPIGTVKSHIKRGTIRLRKALDVYTQPDAGAVDDDD